MTTIPRRRFLSLAGAALALPAVSRVGYAQAYPNRPIRLIVGFVAGGGQSIVAHMIGRSLSERLGQPVVIENRPGAGGNIGAESVIRSAPDGYTFLLCGSPNSINATLYTKLSFNFAQDITPVADIMHVPLIMEVNPDLPAKNVAEFIAYARANRAADDNKRGAAADAPIEVTSKRRRQQRMSTKVNGLGRDNWRDHLLSRANYVISALIKIESSRRRTCTDAAPPGLIQAAYTNCVSEQSATNRIGKFLWVANSLPNQI